MNRDKAIILITYLISPLIGFILSLSSKDRKLLKYSITLSSIWIGFSFAIGSDSNSDITRYQDRYNYIQNADPSISWLLDQMYNTIGYYDVFSPFSIFIFTKLGFSFDFYLGFLGLIFSLFYTKYMFQILDLTDKMTKIKKMIFLFALLVIPIWYGINNIRFTLVTMIFVTSIYEITNNVNIRRNILLLCITPLIHYSVFWVPIIVFIVLLFTKYLNIRLLLLIFIVFTLLPTQSIALQLNLSDFLPTTFEDAGKAYVDSENIANRIELQSEEKESSTFYTQFLGWPYTTIFHMLPILIGLTLVRIKDEISKNDTLLLQWILLFGLIIAIIGTLPSFGRYKAFVILPSILLLFKYWSQIYQPYKFLVWGITFLMTLYSLVKLRTALDYFSETTVFGNIVTIILTDFKDRVPLIDFIKGSLL